MGDIKILIVEDELLIAKGLAKKLEKLEYAVVGIASSSESALQKVEETQPDVILMDIVIKGDLDGIETAKLIQEKFNIPVIYVTAYADDETLERAEETESYGYILKPFKEREVHAAIKIALKKHQSTLKMQESLKEAQAVTDEKSRFLSIASHDLKTPLTAIQMSAGMLKDYSDKWTEDKKQKHLDRIQTSVSNMNNLLEELLILSRAESGKLIFNPEPTQVVAFCQSIIEEIKPLAQAGHRVLFMSSQEVIHGNLDKPLLRHILINLLSNAIKYSPNGGTVSLKIHQDGKFIWFEIADEGIGLPMDYQAKLFQQFERASNVGNIKGTGLGLSIVKQAVDLHQGQIKVESEVGKGTIFTVTLPL
ncbi:hybrid sensor histidine kinase/response regulator [Planktothrix mougeotii]|uniref:histidine kinase n=1 Tax=Planktothrix mougeotii LEGE 06226 TaxID=1828728 RepID=A0ABR9UIG9_9CYAN|nr:ATP-binding protein [Planktothrix mougeotii]MBE9145636.1 response regulator [Planktothrix mougeotii LEGE 06226]